jgi:hypothetical protein
MRIIPVLRDPGKDQEPNVKIGVCTSFYALDHEGGIVDGPFSSEEEAVQAARAQATRAD